MYRTYKCTAPILTCSPFNTTKIENKSETYLLCYDILRKLEAENRRMEKKNITAEGLLKGRKLSMGDQCQRDGEKILMKLVCELHI